MTEWQQRARRRAPVTMAVLALVLGGPITGRVSIGHGVAAPVALPGVGPGVRHVIDVNHAPWRILGRVQTELGARCTGFLVAPSVIMTAAHCLWLDDVGHFVQPSSIHFMLGYDTGAWRATARGVHVIIAPHYDPYHPLRTSQADHATIVLDRPLVRNDELLPVLVAQPGEPAMLAGYQQDRKELAVGDSACHVERARGQLIDHDCAATRGASGAPLLIRRNGIWGIAGIDVTARDGQGGTAVRFGEASNSAETVR